MATKYELPKLGFGFKDLEPIISSEIVELHYTKHHAGYVANLNKALEELEEIQKKGDLVRQIGLQKAIKFNGGGHLNHSLYWENLLPIEKGGGKLMEGPLKEKLIRDFGSFETFVEALTQKTAQIQGSGWGWLGYDKEHDILTLAETKNHNLLLVKKGLYPLLCLDAWEHAYYLQYKNNRAQYLKAIWSIIHWKVVEDRLKAAQK